MQRLTGEDHVHADEVRIPTPRQRDNMSRPIFSGYAGIEKDRNRFRMKGLANLRGRSGSPVASNGIVLNHALCSWSAPTRPFVLVFVLAAIIASPRWNEASSYANAANAWRRHTGASTRLASDVEGPVVSSTCGPSSS